MRRRSNSAQEVWKASGGENWSKVKEIRFHFHRRGKRERNSRTRSITGTWRRGTDRVKWKGKDVTVESAERRPQRGMEKAAYARWVNDSYWLLAPLKVLDPGVKLTAEGQKESEGVKCETLRLSFAQVGLTPGDQYVLYIDPQTKLLRAWDYIPKPETSRCTPLGKSMKTFGGLKLATRAQLSPARMIRFADMKVVTRVVS